jgi:hypothetical protein
MKAVRLSRPAGVNPSCLAGAGGDCANAAGNTAEATKQASSNARVGSWRIPLVAERAERLPKPKIKT